MTASPTLFIVVPCYCEQQVLPLSHPRLLEQLQGMAQRSLISPESRILYVDDGSTDGTWPIIHELAESCREVCALRLSCNVGHQNALIAGMEAAVELCDCMVTIDADLQDDPSVIEQMVSQHAAGIDVVYGVRRARKTDTWFKRTSALAFYRVMKSLGVRSVYNHADYRLLSRRAVHGLLDFRERNLFLRGLVPLVGYASSSVYYDRAARQAGESKYSLRQMLNFAADGITSISVKPVRMVLSLGVIFLAIALAILIYVLVSFFSGNAISGWSSIILSLWFIGGCILIGLGIVGEYIGKIYIEVKGRPRYHIDQSIIH